MRSIQLRSLPSIVIATFVALGAFGCDIKETGGGTGDGGPGPEPITCEPGFHVETICSDDCNQPCKDECVPDAVCPDGSVAQWTCVDPMKDPDGGDIVCDSGMEDCPPPPDPGQCYLECVPIGWCGDGFHEEWVCDGGPPKPPDDPSMPDGGGMSPDDPSQPPEPCYPICVPDEPVCPDGQPPIEVCEGDPDGQEPGPCQLVCGDEPPPPPDDQF